MRRRTPSIAEGAATAAERWRRLPAACAAALVAGALLAGCSTASNKDESAPADSKGVQPAPQGGSDKDDAADSDGKSGTDVDARKREVVQTADLAVEVPKLRRATTRAKAWVDDAGGHVSSENVSTANGDTPKASLTLKVPKDRYEDALTELGDLGDQVDLSRETDDVTKEVADVDSRVKSSEASIDRLRELLKDADNVQDVLDVQSEIDSRQEDLEALKAQQKALDDQTAMSTVNLDLSPPDTYLAKDERDSIGFTGGLLRGWHALVTVGQGAAVGLGWLLPFLGVAAAIAAPVVLWWRRRRRQPTPTAHAAATSGSDADDDASPTGSSAPS